MIVIRGGLLGVDNSERYGMDDKVRGETGGVKRS
jgi:hypothetical protein